MAEAIVSGIYAITNKVNGKMYIGSSVALPRRISRHKTDLNRNAHDNNKLQRAWNRYGAESFEFSVLELVADASALIEREQYWIDSTNACVAGYNLAPKAGSCLGVKKTAEAVEKTAAAHRGMKRSDETRKKIREARAVQPKMSDAGRAKISEALSKRVISESTRKKLSLANLGRKMSPEAVEKNRLGHIGIRVSDATKEKLRLTSSGKKHTEASKKKMSEWQIGRKMSPEAIAKSSAARRGRKTSDETKAKISAATKGVPKSAETIARMSESAKERNWKPSEKMIEAAKKANTGKKFSPEVIAKRIETRKRNKELKLSVAQQAA